MSLNFTADNPPPPDLYYPLPTEELQINLAINQLAILHILNVTRGLCTLDTLGRESVEERDESLQEERDKQHLQESREAIQRMEEEMRHLQEVMGQLRNNLTTLSQGGESTVGDESCAMEVQQLRQELSALNISVMNNHGGADCDESGEFHISNDCTINVCLQGSLHPYQGSSAPKVLFSDLVAMNCIHLEKTNMSWDAARANCVSLKGDLFVAGDIKGAAEYIRKETNFRHVWLGVKQRSWLDGRRVADEEWQTHQPNDGTEQCADTYTNDGYKALWDHDCTDTYFSLCHVGVSYPSHLLN